MARKTGKREILQPRTRAIGAGITERWYLKHLKQCCGFTLELKPRLFGNESVAHIRKLIEDAQSEGCPVVCFFDEDVRQWNPAEGAKMDDLMKAYRDSSEVVLATSMPSIEYWFLLHFENTNRLFRTSDDVIQKLRHHMPSFEKHEKFLSEPKWVSDMIGDGKMDTACRRAESFGTSGMSYTNVWKAIKFLQRLENTGSASQ